jgi:Ca2+-transporting ATPase
VRPSNRQFSPGLSTVNAARLLKEGRLLFGAPLRTFSARDPIRPVWELRMLSNWKLVAIVAMSFVVQIDINHIPASHNPLQTSPLSLSDCFLSIALGSVTLVVLELAKVLSAASGRLQMRCPMNRS